MASTWCSRRASATLAAALTILASESPRAQEGMPPTRVETTAVVIETISETFSLPGTARPIRDSVVASEVEGRVAERSVENGQHVRRGTVLVRLDSSRLKQDLAVARARLEEVEAQLALAIRQEDRATELHRDEVMSQRDLDEATFNRQALQGRQSATAATIASIEDDIARTEIRAPFTGVVTALHVEVGEWVERGGAIVRLADLETLEVRLEVPERYFSRLRRNAETRVRVDALPQLEIVGRIFSVVPQADNDARTFPVLVRADNPGRGVGAGMLCTVVLSLVSTEPALLVPKDAVVRQAQREVVFVAEQGVARLVPVRTGRADGDRIEVFGELQPGDAVVVRGNERLAPGQPLQVEGGHAGAATRD